MIRPRVQETESFVLLIKRLRNRHIFSPKFRKYSRMTKVLLKFFSPLSCTAPTFLLHSISLLKNTIVKKFSPSGNNPILTNNFVHWMAHIDQLVSLHSLGKTDCSLSTFVNVQTIYHCIRQICKLWANSRNGLPPIFQESNEVVWRQTMKGYVTNWVFSLIISCKL